MHILLRGGALQRLRLASGLVLFTFAATHFINHAFGLVSFEIMHQIEEVRTAVTRSVVGSTILGAALVTHISLGLYKLAMRRTLKLPPWEAAQIVVALLIPFLLFPHIVNTRVAHAFFGVNDIYLYELFRLWPDRGFLQSLLLVLVWTHGCIGLHYWLRLSDTYQTVRPVLWTVAGIIPVLALAGFIVAGRATADIMSDPTALATLKQRSNWPSPAAGDTMAWLRDLTQYVFGALIAIVATIFFLRHRANAHKAATLTYRDGPTVPLTPGMTILEISRSHGIPHASICGGRGRCFTCRVRIDSGIAKLPHPNPTERIALEILESPPNVRLACQLYPARSMSVTILNRPGVPGPVGVNFIEVKAVVSAHVLASLGQRVTETDSSERSSLAEWFVGKIHDPVPVPNLTEPFSILGARVDYIQGSAIPALVLTAHGRLISLYLTPAAEMDAVRANRDGYSIVGWNDTVYTYFAVSDCDRDTLEALQNMIAEQHFGVERLTFANAIVGSADNDLLQFLSRKAAGKPA